MCNVVCFDKNKIIPDVFGHVLKCHPLNEIYSIQQITSLSLNLETVS